MRIIPSCMATQHPDNATPPLWYSRPFLSTQAEVKESMFCFKNLDIDEYNWDWEGKFVDEAVVDRLLHKHLPFFRKNPLGEKKFLTFRLPNPRVEKQFRLARAFMVIITSNQLTKSLGFPSPPIFETILPLTETAEEILEMQRAYEQLVQLEHNLLKLNTSLTRINIIPLFEQVHTIIRSADLIKKYLSLHKKTFGVYPDHLRPYCARSDPALNAGLIPTMIALKLALSSYQVLESETGIPMFPMVGTGSLPFRGGVSPETIDQTLDEYAGFKTLTLQSAFRYDYPIEKVKAAVKKIKTELQKRKARRITKSQSEQLESLIPLCEHPYKQTVESIAPIINVISTHVPRRRERMQHIGLFGYSRGIGNITLPRAIPFTAALYALGIPPELIGSGRGIDRIRRSEKWSLLKETYRNIASDIRDAGRFLNKKNLALLARTTTAWEDIKKDVTVLEEEFGELEPIQANEKEHEKRTTRMYRRMREGKDITEDITASGVLRKSLG